MADKKNKKFKYLVVVAVGFTIVALLLSGLYIWKITPRPYSAVVLTTGDVYFGKVSYFPMMTISDVYIIQATENPENPAQPSLQLLPLNTASVWAPEELVLNRDQVVSVSKIGKSSQLMELIEGQNVAR